MSDIVGEEEEITEEEKLLRSSCLRVMRKCCKNCLFGEEKLVSDSRKKDILEECETNDRFFICHEGSTREQVICCRAFYEHYKNDIAPLKLARFYERIQPGSVRFVYPS